MGEDEMKTKNKKISEIFNNVKVAMILVIFTVLVILSFVTGQYSNYMNIYEMANGDIEENILKDYTCLPKGGKVLWNDSGAYDIPSAPPIEEKFEEFKDERRND